MSNRTRGLMLIAAGALLMLIGLLADVIGLGGFPGVGWKQVVATLLGLAAAVMGYRDMRR